MSGFFVIKKKIFVENKKIYIVKALRSYLILFIALIRILGLKIIKLNLSQEKITKVK